MTDTDEKESVILGLKRLNTYMQFGWDIYIVACPATRSWHLTLKVPNNKFMWEKYAETLEELLADVAMLADEYIRGIAID